MGNDDYEALDSSYDDDMEELPTRYSVVGYMDVLGHSDVECAKIMAHIECTLNSLRGVRNAHVEEV